ncbi:MAG: hypothetical protein KDA24_01570 [Deltaproteobacteria bacterium]|nr:hypothetical protein [Deltaproteobacteria bacterium]
MLVRVRLFAFLLALLFALPACNVLSRGGGGGGADDDDDDSAMGDDDDATQPSPTDLDGDTILNDDEDLDDAIDTDGDGTIDAEDTDADNDGIHDFDEAGDDNPDTAPVDTDGDGTADFRDLDSDNDGIDDLTEAGDGNINTPPVDTDEDEIPDFQDEDADGDNIPDSLEGQDDPDGDGIPNFQDDDSDGDGISDKVEGITDSDLDGTSDYLDLDSDADGILDATEGGGDQDGDGVPNYADLDSDADGIPDATEGDVDSDGDTLIDALDTDSDNDGLSDEFEVGIGTDVTSDDSDGDGSSDLIESALGTNPLDGNDNPANNGDLVFVSPARSPIDPAVGTVDITTNYQEADVYFLIDKTCSMGDEMSAMRSAVVNIINDLTCDSFGACTEDSNCASDQVCGLGLTCIDDPQIYGCVPSFWSGAGVYGGSGSSYPITNLQSVTSNASAVQGVLPTSVGNYGADETLFQAAQCIATPSACPSNRITGCAGTVSNCPGFRADSVRILVQITDEMDEYNHPSFTANTAGSALQSLDINYVGVDADVGHEGLADLTSVANAAGSLDSMGNPFVRSGSNASVSTSVTSALQEIIGQVPLEATIEVVDMPGDSGDALLFIDHIEVNQSNVDINGDGVTDCAPETANDSDADGWNDFFPAATPGVGLCWDLVAANNEWVVQTAAIQTYQAQVTLRGNGAILDQVSAWFVVPPLVPQ